MMKYEVEGEDEVHSKGLKKDGVVKIDMYNTIQYNGEVPKLAWWQPRNKVLVERSRRKVANSVGWPTNDRQGWLKEANEGKTHNLLNSDQPASAQHHLLNTSLAFRPGSEGKR